MVRDPEPTLSEQLRRAVSAAVAGHAREIDTDPAMVMLTVTVRIDRRSREVRRVLVHRESEYDDRGRAFDSR